MKVKFRLYLMYQIVLLVLFLAGFIIVLNILKIV
jgi:hypothetical protein